MKLAILGRHPVFSPGFNSTMSFFIAVGFAELGWDVTVAYPNAPPLSSREITGLQEFSELMLQYDPRHRVLWSNFTEFFSSNSRFDVGIWQTYAPEDEAVFIDFRERAGLISKNFPRFFDNSESDKRRLANALKKFDVIGFALKEDYDISAAMDLGSEINKRLAFVGRGSCPELLRRVKKSKQPSIFVDNPPKPIDGTGEKALHHVWKTIALLKKEAPELEIRTFGGKQAPDDVQRSAAAPFWKFYESLLAPSWFYFTFNYSFTTHAKRRVELDHGKWIFLGQYENQVIETHLSGGLVIAHINDLPRELVPTDVSQCIFTDFSDIEDISNRILNSIKNFTTLGNAAQRFAVANHDFRLMANRWNSALHLQ